MSKYINGQDIDRLQDSVEAMEATITGSFSELCQRLDTLSIHLENQNKLVAKLIDRCEKSIPIKVFLWVVGIIALAFADAKLLEYLPQLINHFQKGAL